MQAVQQILTDDMIRYNAPSAFADHAHGSRSGRYAFIPTSKVISAMRASATTHGDMTMKKSDAKILAEANALDAQYAAAAAFDSAHVADGREPTHHVYRLVLDNGSDYSAELPGDYDTEEDAEVAGKEWLAQFYIDNEIAEEDREFDGAGYDVVEVAVYADDEE